LRKAFFVPFCKERFVRESDNFQLIDDYSRWLVNNR
jgi:hypothetical protein